KQARQLVQERDELVIVVRERHAAYAGERERDLRHLDRVVVNEHKRVEAEVESLRELADLSRFSVVAGDDRDEVVLTQQQAPRAKWRHHDVGIVATHGREDGALAPQPAQQALIDEVPVSTTRRLAGNALRSLLGDQSAPQ